MTTWVTWSPRGHDLYTNPRSKVAHATSASPHDVRNGGFPLACGRYAPDGHDAIISESSGARCRRCEKALAKTPCEHRNVTAWPGTDPGYKYRVCDDCGADLGPVPV